jgi:hypothetical protein
MSERYPKFGIFGPDKELVQALAQNPIFAPISLTLRKSETKTPLGLVDQAMHRFGKDSLRSVTRLAESGSEPEYALALMRTGNPEMLIDVLERIPNDARISAVRVINHHGLQVLQQAERVVRSGSFDSQAFLQPVADALVHKSEKIIPVHPIALKHPLKPEHERQLLFFYDQPPLWQRNIARAVRAYRSIYTLTYSRILYD